MILLIDNYDSFVHNLARYFEQLGQETKVVRNDAIDVAAAKQLAPQAIVLSPGPCAPAEAGCSKAMVREFFDKLPILGICLGHQVIAEALGGRIVQALEPRHGRTSQVEHQQTSLFSKIPSPLTVCRYHSLVVERDSLPTVLQVSATSADGTIMAIEHSVYPVFGVQFHPEAILTEHGYQLLANFLSLAGLATKADINQLQQAECRTTKQKLPQLPQKPVTF